MLNDPFLNVESVKSGNLFETIAPLLLSGVVVFCYESSKGKRLSYGTLKPELIPPITDKKFLKIRTELTGKVAEMKTWDVGLPDDPEYVKKLINELESLVMSMYPGDGSGKVKPEGIITYYDLGVQGFRRFSKDNLLSIYTLKVVD